VNDTSKPFFFQALDALKLGDRRGAALALERQLRGGNTAQKNLPSVSELATHIGEIDLAIEAMHRAVVPGSVESLMAYWAVLARYGRSDEAVADIKRQSTAIRNHPAVLHFTATAATQFGRFDEAQELFRRALAGSPSLPASWLSLAMIKRFHPGDPDIGAMEQVEARSASDPEARAMLCYALGKAWEECGDVDRAFEFWSRGAGLQRQQGVFNTGQFGRAADRIIQTFTPDSLAKLTPSNFSKRTSLFVTGLPRSGTTLTEQILRGHSSVADGDEANLFAPALIPLLGIGMPQALTYQQRLRHDDPWGEIARDYARFMQMRFRTRDVVVDKSLGQSLLTGLILHALPEARIAWLRRSPDDVALSCFRTFFATGQPWTRSLADIADYMRTEDKLFAHWLAIFPDRILVVPYEELVREPGDWSERLQDHFGLGYEPGLESSSREGRAISSASVSQAREPISASRIGQAAMFERHLQPFRDRYYAN